MTVPVQVVVNPGDFTTAASATVDPESGGGRTAAVEAGAQAGEAGSAEAEARRGGAGGRVARRSPPRSRARSCALILSAAQHSRAIVRGADHA